MRPSFTYRPPIAYRAPQLFRARPYEGYRLAWLYDRATQSVQELTEPGGGWDSNSVPYGQTPAVVTGDLMILPLLTDPGLYAVTPQADGGFEVDLQGDGSRQILRNVNLYDRSLAVFYGASDQAINDQSPITLFELGLDRIYPTGDDPADEDLSLWFADPEADVLEFTLSPDSPDPLPSWMSLVGSALTITDPVTPQSIDLLFRATDPYGAYAETAFRAVTSSQVAVPNVLLILANEAEDLIAAANLVVNYDEGQYSSLYLTDIILSQSPDPDTLVDAGSIVTLIRSLGQAPEELVTPDLILVRATRSGFFGGYQHAVGDTFQISAPRHFSPYWMTLIDTPPIDWLPYLEAYDPLIDFDIIDIVPSRAKVTSDFRQFYG